MERNKRIKISPHTHTRFINFILRYAIYSNFFFSTRFLFDRYVTFTLFSFIDYDFFFVLYIQVGGPNIFRQTPYISEHTLSWLKRFTSAQEWNNSSIHHSIYSLDFPNKSSSPLNFHLQFSFLNSFITDCKLKTIGP